MSEGVQQTFEEKLERIDEIVRRLESGRVELDEAVKLFKEGKQLAAQCEQLLKSSQDAIDAAMREDGSAAG